MKKIIFATGNKGKLKEASEILGKNFTLITPADLGILEEIPETGSTLRENSIQKADYLWEKCKVDCFADDTGLEIDMLNGEPGVYTARYAGESKSFEDNMTKVLEEMDKVEMAASFAAGMGLEIKPLERTARFKSVITLILNGEKICFEGCLEGWISRSRSGSFGFGYDPIFIAKEYPNLSLADISEAQKNEISHRGQALRKMAAYLKEIDLTEAQG